MIMDITAAALEVSAQLVKLIILAIQSETGKISREDVLTEITRIRSSQTAAEAAEWARVRGS